MSRIGKQPIPVPSGVDVKIDGSTVTVKGPKGELTQTFTDVLTIELQDGELVVTRPDDSRTARSLHGLTRTLLSNMVTGVSDGFSKNLEIVGVGYRAILKGSDLELQLGFSHPVVVVGRAGHHVRGAGSRPRSLFGASTSSRSVRLPRTSASGASRSPTRARAFATRASTFVASWARPPSRCCVAIRPVGR